MMRLSRLVDGFPVSPLPPGLDPEVSGIAHDSRRVRPGDLFVALSGACSDGRRFAMDAARAGAVAVLAGEGTTAAGVSLPWLTTAEPRVLVGPLAARIYGHPDRELTLVGVTGTNGKSTVTALVGAILEAAGRPTGMLGTLGYRFRDRSFPGGHTTPEAPDFFAILRAMCDAGAEAVAMEVSSHALAQHRVSGARFDVAIFTNLTRDHLDFHGDLDHYFAAKRHLFDLMTPEGRAVVNRDDPYGRRLAEELAPATRVLTCGMGEGDVFLAEVELSSSGSRGVLATPRGTIPFETPLLGRYNLLNVLAAVAAAEALSLPHRAVAQALATFQPLPGRLEPVDAGQGFPVLVDYAHTPAALAAALTSLRELSGKKIAVVFGCGGDRDPGKRPLMGETAGTLADRVLATSDNPRSEDPLAILAQVEEGLARSGNPHYRIVPDRREAIREALAGAGEDWAVLVAGKGHEAVQIVGDRQLPFSDREEIERAWEGLSGGQGEASW